MNKTILTVSELNRDIRFLLEKNFGYIHLRGEISGLARPGSGHLYFQLKDADAQISCVMFRMQARRLKFDLENGQELIARGKVTVYEPRGNYQLIIEQLEPEGAGALQLAFDQMKVRLEKEGLFAPERKKEIPFLPEKIGIVTSPTGAAIQDMLNVLKRRFPSVPVVIAPVLVQGEKAAEEIAEGIRQLDAREDIDLMIVGRGGGSMEDLWAFNEEIVARAIAKAGTPVISAVGHETDFTIADFVADVRAATPSVAAELAVPDAVALKNTVLALDNRLRSEVEDLLGQAKQRLSYADRLLQSPERAVQTYSQKTDELTMRLQQSLRMMLIKKQHSLEKLDQALERRSPTVRLQEEKAHLLLMENRLQEAIQKRMLDKRRTFENLTIRLDANSPLKILKKGFTAATDSKGNLISSIQQVKEKDVLKLRLNDGILHGRVEKVLSLKDT